MQQMIVIVIVPETREAKTYSDDTKVYWNTKPNQHILHHYVRESVTAQHGQLH